MIWKYVRMAALALVFTSPALADYEAGKRAWNDGRLDEALEQWRLAANAGDGRAMVWLGRMHREGYGGVPQNFVEAHKWFNLAAGRGETAALRERDALDARMTPEERAEAQSRARMWPPGGTQAAGAPARSEGQGTDRPPPKAIREAQTLLARHGYDPGPINGVWNSNTIWAYQRFLRDTSLPISQILTRQALRALRDLGGGGNEPQRPLTPRTAGSTTTVPPGVLVRAAAASDINGLQAAIEAGADLKARDQKGMTALMYAADRGFTLMVQLLLDAGANPDERAVHGPTPLFMAVAKEHIEIAEMLLESGADASIRGLKGMTPLKLAERMKHSEIVGLLKKNARETEAARRAQEDSDEFEQAKSLDTRQAYEGYVSSQCPRGNFCKAARARIDELHFEQATSLDTRQAYATYVSSRCPRGNFCEAARNRIDELIGEGLAGKIFGGTNSKKHWQAYQFSPTGDVIGVYRGGASFLFGGKCTGSWRVNDGKVRVDCKSKGSGGTAAVAELKGDTLVGREESASGKKKPWTWRMNVRVGEVLDAGPKTTRTPQSSGSER